MPATEGIKRTGVNKGYFSLEDIEEFSKLNEEYDLNSLSVDHSGSTLLMSTCIRAKRIPKKELNDILQCLSNSKNFNIDKVENFFCLNVVLRKW
ncbi:MAG: hypothetical protein U0X86_001134 [Wolbachia endosymbiont of Xenopsylla cheopis]